MHVKILKHFRIIIFTIILSGYSLACYSLDASGTSNDISNKLDNLQNKFDSTMTGFNIIMTAGSFILTVSGIVLAFLGYINLTRAHKIVDERIGDRLQQLKDEFGIEFGKVQEATQKMIAGYDNQHRGNVDVAIQLYLAAIEIYPKVFNGYTSLGYAYLQKHDIPQALLAFNDATRMNPNKIQSYNDLAIVFAKLHNKEQCIKNIKIMARMDLNSIEFLLSDNTIVAIVDEQTIREIFEDSLNG